MSKYVYDLTKSSDVSELIKDIQKDIDLFKNRKFKEFIAEKCLKELKDICDIVTFSMDFENSVFHEKVQEYEQSHKKVIGSNHVTIYNSTRLAQDEMFWVSTTTRENYPHGISIAKIVEYGTGIKGTSQDDWQTDVNGHGAKAWAYYNPDSINGWEGASPIIWSHGIEGKFVYQKLYDRIIENFEMWTIEFLDKEIP